MVVTPQLPQNTYFTLGVDVGENIIPSLFHCRETVVLIALLQLLQNAV